MRRAAKVDANGLTRYQRYYLRKRGFDVPKLRPGGRAPDFDYLVEKGDGCWSWHGQHNRDGYGVHLVDGHTKQAHRTMYEREVGPILPGLVIMHLCDNPGCINPAHLRAATQAENIADKVAKGRQAKGSRLGSARLTEAQVIEARARYRFRSCTYQMLADEYGVSKDTMQKAIRGINWGHLASGG